ncbi:PhzF family phenazine biosynthesis protein [Loktanella sp. IMCC34160]|uniref:PhzF family phenazine biosynthesis protein n=1 Tax=Loktanella sp. IMCC34160 TaxID=2510646 RepID=UPI00101C4DC1|nr:PhzF family phenazine biosynthesis protein [Loktanella sp. IMCC34160]RYG91737.1 PhzF family phenazine biosynthesis protein [Loktanella sp. IMCC34160]
MTEFFVYDVFTDAPFGGNQLAVIPDATALPEDKLQKIAREFNFSETVFLYPSHAAEHTARLRIFTPTMEVPFAGHPTIGAAVALSDLGKGPEMILELGIGPLPAHAKDGAAEFSVPAKLEDFGQPDPDLVAACLGLPAAAVDCTVHAPIQCSLGLPFTFVRLDSRDSLSACLPVTDAFREGARRFPTPLDFAIYAYVRDGDRVDARMFAPLDNIPEDPATGSAAATLTALLARIGKADQTLTIHQGMDMGRPSVIRAETGDGMVTISGNAVRTMAGTLAC